MRINQLPAATEVAQNDVLAIDTSNGTYQVPRSVLAPSPYVATIPTGQWSGSSSDYYITVTASNVTADSILIPHFDADSEANLQGPVWCVPAAGSFTIHTNTLPIGTVTILVQFIGIMGEAQYQVLADVYSKSQTYSKSEAVAKADVVNNLTSTATDKPLSANMGKALNEAIAQSTPKYIQHYNTDDSNIVTIEVPTAYKRANYIVLTPVGIATLATDSANGMVTHVYDPSDLVVSQSDNTIVVRLNSYYRGATIIGFA